MLRSVAVRLLHFWSNSCYVLRRVSLQSLQPDGKPNEHSALAGPSRTRSAPQPISAHICTALSQHSCAAKFRADSGPGLNHFKQAPTAPQPGHANSSLNGWAGRGRATPWPAPAKEAG